MLKTINFRYLLYHRRYILRRIALLLLIGLSMLIVTQLYLTFGERIRLSLLDQQPAEVDIAHPLFNADPEPAYAKYDGSLMTYVKDAFEDIRQLIFEPSWNYQKNANEMSLSREACSNFFPGMYGELHRASRSFEKFHITTEDLAEIDIVEGRVHAGLKDGKLYVLQTNLETQHSRARAYSVLESLRDAISHVPQDDLPAIEFVFSVHEQVRDVTKPVWVFDRREQDVNVWLMPLFNELYSQQSSTIDGSNHDLRKDSENANGAKLVVPARTGEVVSEIEGIESKNPFETKTDLLVGAWRTGEKPSTTEIQSLSEVADGKEWAETLNMTVDLQMAGFDAAAMGVLTSDFGDDPSFEMDHEPVSLSEMCRYKYLAYAATPSIPITAGPLLCASVVFVTQPEWINIYHGVMLGDVRTPETNTNNNPAVQNWKSKGAGKQNVVVVRKDWKDLDAKMTGLLENGRVAEQIAKNAAVNFRERYLTKAARTCYWRELIHTYRSVSVKPDDWIDVTDPDTPHSSTDGTRKAVRWETYRNLDEGAQASLKKTGWV